MPDTIAETLRSRLDDASDDEKVDLLFSFLRDRGQSNYDEAVTQIEHALQSADLAAQDGCSEQAVTAALLHDIGHLLLDEHDGQSGFLNEDLNHEQAGAELLAAYFPEQVTEPIRLHVAAKRYLCTTDPHYYDELSEASKRSFQLQGGRLSTQEQAGLEANSELDIALKLRRFDDQAKQQGRATPPLESYRQLVKRCLRPQRP